MKTDNMQLPIYQVDAFASALFSGNPAAVCPLQSWLPDYVMQAIAAENNLSETAFFVPNESGYHLRWFTPAAEVDFCGHATLATAHVLFSELDFQNEEILFTTRVGILKVKNTQKGYAMDFPADPPKMAEMPPHIVQALGLKPSGFYRGTDDFLAILEHEEQVMNLQPDFTLINQLPARGLVVTAPGKNHDFISRGFFPQVGINEDPVTGSAHTMLLPFWSNRLDKKRLTARQGGNRQGELIGTLMEDRVVLEGPATTYLKGQIFLPD